jgi:hypothetical protein
MEGFLYILSNVHMPGLLKVGRTSKVPSRRAWELWDTGVPDAFVVEHYWYVEDCRQAERDAHDALASWRVSAEREFFRGAIEDAVEEIRSVLVGVRYESESPSRNLMRTIQRDVGGLDYGDTAASIPKLEPRSLPAALSHESLVKRWLALNFDEDLLRAEVASVLSGRIVADWRSQPSSTLEEIVCLVPDARRWSAAMAELLELVRVTCVVPSSVDFLYTVRLLRERDRSDLNGESGHPRS